MMNSSFRNASAGECKRLRFQLIGLLSGAQHMRSANIYLPRSSALLCNVTGQLSVALVHMVIVPNATEQQPNWISLYYLLN